MLADKVSPQAGTLYGRYRLVEKAGAGGMSEVWKAEDTTLNRTVAVKVILTPIAEDTSYRERFLREARLVAALEHPNVLPVYDYGTQTVEGVEFSYLVMPLVLGGSLRAHITGPMPFSITVVWLQAIAAALDHAHAKGILHRDVKPGNVLLDVQGRPMLADFGLARSSTSTSGLTQAGVALGTPLYMAPEQAQGLPLDGRTDQYALAVIAFEILTGLVPFRADSPMLLLHQHAVIPPPRASSIVSDIPAEADVVLAKALEKKPTDRFPSCFAFVQALAVALGVPLAPVVSGPVAARIPRPTPGTAPGLGDASEERTDVEPKRFAPTLRLVAPASSSPSPDSPSPEPTAPAPSPLPLPPARATPTGRPGGLRALLVAAVILVGLLLAVAVVSRLRSPKTAEVEPSPPTPLSVPSPAAPVPTPVPEAVSPSPFPSPAAAPPRGPLVTDRPSKRREPPRAKPTAALEETQRSLDEARAAEEARTLAAEAAAAARAAAPPKIREGDLLDIAQVDTEPSVVTRVRPEVTPMARLLQVEGTVVLRVLVNERGQSEVVEILRDTKRRVGLAESSRDAIGRWTWTPAMKDGKKVKTWITVAVPFVIR